MKNSILSDWNFMRVIRLALGVFLVVQGIITGDWTFSLLGGLFTLMPLFNIGCCGASGCNVPDTKSRKPSSDITYEEVH